LNGLTMRNLTMLSISDSCPFGLGGFTTNGSAWRLKLRGSSPIHGDCVSNNVLEFLAMTTTVWLTLLECKAQGLKDELILALGDNTSAIGWMTRTGHLTPSSIYYQETSNYHDRVRELSGLPALARKEKHGGRLAVIRRRQSISGNEQRSCQAPTCL
jgi:hypothetical protein